MTLGMDVSLLVIVKSLILVQTLINLPKRLLGLIWEFRLISLKELGLE